MSEKISLDSSGFIYYLRKTLRGSYVSRKFRGHRVYSVNCHFTTESPLPSFSLMKQPFSELLMLHHNRRSYTNTKRVPSCKLEILRILASLGVTHGTRTVIRRRTFHFYTGHEVHILPTFIIGSSKSLVCFRCC